MECGEPSVVVDYANDLDTGVCVASRCVPKPASHERALTLLGVPATLMQLWQRLQCTA